MSETEDATPALSNEENAPAVESGQWTGPSLRPELQRFASWAFGPHGILSLQVIAVGDYAHGGRDMRGNNFFLCRYTEEGRRFRHLAAYELTARTVYAEYRNVLEACPVVPLLGSKNYFS